VPRGRAGRTRSGGSLGKSPGTSGYIPRVTERTLAALRLTGACLAAALLAGCAGLPDLFTPPALHLDRVVVRGLGVTGGAMDLVLGVYNPNQFAVRGTRLQVGFDVEGSHVGDVEYDDDFQVQKGDTTQLTLPLRFEWSGLAGAAKTVLASGDIPYTLKGQLTVATPLGDRVVPFTREGRAPLSRAAEELPSRH
jgi:LEA14-like dessication related protein